MSDSFDSTINKIMYWVVEVFEKVMFGLATILAITVIYLIYDIIKTVWERIE